jgi:hypothetical protein
MRRSTDKIWYCAYGSNLYQPRLNLYLRGGKLSHSSHVYVACEDTTHIQAVHSGRIAHRLYFARHSLVWGGGKAFVDIQTSFDEQKYAHTAFYLLNRGQFEHLVWQENWQNNLSHPIQLPIAELAREPFPAVILSAYKSDYDALMYFGDKPDPTNSEVCYPVMTTTLHAGMRESELEAPSEAYLECIIKGLKSHTDMTAVSINAYLKTVIAS